MERFTRIEQNLEIMGGRPSIKGLRVTVGMIVSQIGEGKSPKKLIAEYPYLSVEDVYEAIRYAAWAVNTTESALMA